MFEYGFLLVLLKVHYCLGRIQCLGSGSCVLLSECPALRGLADSGQPKNIRLVRQSICEFKDDSALVCCTNAISTTSQDQNVNSTTTHKIQDEILVATSSLDTVSQSKATEFTTFETPSLSRVTAFQTKRVPLVKASRTTSTPLVDDFEPSSKERVTAFKTASVSGKTTVTTPSVLQPTSFETHIGPLVSVLQPTSFETPIGPLHSVLQPTSFETPIRPLVSAVGTSNLQGANAGETPSLSLVIAFDITSTQLVNGFGTTGLSPADNFETHGTPLFTTFKTASTQRVHAFGPSSVQSVNTFATSSLKEVITFETASVPLVPIAPQFATLEDPTVFHTFQTFSETPVTAEGTSVPGERGFQIQSSLRGNTFQTVSVPSVAAFETSSFPGVLTFESPNVPLVNVLETLNAPSVDAFEGSNWPSVTDFHTHTVPLADTFESPNVPSVDAFEGPNEPLINVLETRNISSIDTFEGPNVPSANDFHTPNVHSTDAFQIPNVPSVDAFESPNEPSIGASIESNVPSVSDFETPKLPLVNVLVTPNAPSVDAFEGSNWPSVTDFHTHTVPLADTFESPNVPSVDAFEGPNGPLINVLETPNISSIDTFEGPNVPSANNSHTPNVPSTDAVESQNVQLFNATGTSSVPPRVTAVNRGDFAKPSESPKAPPTPNSIAAHSESTKKAGESLLPKKCGHPQTDDKIFGGTPAPIGAYPWIVAIGYVEIGRRKIQFLCSGSLINSRYVLTAGHCLDPEALGPRRLSVIHIGDWDVSTKEDCEKTFLGKKCSPPHIVAGAEGYVIHPQYNVRATSSDDIGLIRLNISINFNDTNAMVEPICLPAENELHPREAAQGRRPLVAGWGFTEHGNRSDTLLRIYLPFAKDEDCQREYGSQFVSKQLCLGGQGGIDTCSGDSGSPLILSGSFGPPFMQIGIVSFGSLPCGMSNVPAVYTSVIDYRDWIIQNLRP